MRAEVGLISCLKDSMTEVMNDEVLMQFIALKFTEFHCTKNTQVFLINYDCWNKNDGNIEFNIISYQ